MSKGLKHIMLAGILFAAFMMGKQLAAEPRSATDSLPTINEYRELLDSAYRYEQEGDFQKATKYYAKGFESYKNHYISQLQNINQLLSHAYEVDKKEQELEQLNRILLLRKKQTLLFTILIIFLLAAIISFFFLQKYRLRTARLNRQQKENETVLLKLEKEKKEMEAQLNTLQAEKYRKELMAGALLVEYKNRVLEELRRFFAKHSALEKYLPNFEEIMNAEVQPELEGTEFQNSMQQIHPAFYGRLQKKADNKLTPLDLKYCRMIYLKMSSKEMADILQVEPRTIRVNKYRLKQKLGLGKEADLDGFIAGMG